MLRIHLFSEFTLPYSNEQLNDIYNKTDGYCHICGKKLSFTNYALVGERGAWEVDHSEPLRGGGTGYYRNLVPACIECNRSKGATSGRRIRSRMEPVTPGGKIVKSLGLPDGFLGASRRKRPRS